jgi:UDP-2-acetamido-3-amino-2,3-dideoxy-glucuronate N-acetyltransferase
MPTCHVGDRCTLGQNVFVGAGVRLGNGCKVQNNVSLYEGVTCEDEVFLGPSCVFTNVLNPRAAIERKDKFLPTHVERGATIGANATIVCGVRIGRYALVAAGAVVTADVLPYALMTGVPARRVGWVSRCGHALRFEVDNTALCPETGEQYALQDDQVSLLT